MSGMQVAPAIVVAAGKTNDGTAYYEAKWRDRDDRQVKRRLGRAWVEPDGTGGWRKRRGRTPAGWLDERSVHIAAAEAVAAVERERASAAQAARQAEQAAQLAAAAIFRNVAQEWLVWKREVKGGSPSTLRDNEALLREPGTPFKRGDGVSEGRIMKRFGDQPIETVTTREVSQFLRKLDRSGMPPRNVNKHRALLHAIFAYAMREDTHGLAANPVSGTDTRHEPPAPPLDHYEVAEVEALARVCEQGGHRGARNYRGRSVEESEQEVAARVAEDQQDAAFFRVLFFSGLRLGEALALRWRHVLFLPDMTGAVLDVRRAVSAGVEKEPKGRRPRQVPLPRPAAEALARLGQRDEFTTPDDYVFGNRLGRRLDASAIRRRYKRAAAAAGLRPVKLHGLRHAAGSVLARSLPLVTVRDVLGHAKLETTNRYLHSKIDPAAIVAMNAAFGVQPEGARALGPHQRR
jgi:integrase